MINTHIVVNCEGYIKANEANLLACSKVSTMSSKRPFDDSDGDDYAINNGRNRRRRLQVVDDNYNDDDDNNNLPDLPLPHRVVEPNAVVPDPPARRGQAVGAADGAVDLFESRPRWAAAFAAEGDNVPISRQKIAVLGVLVSFVRVINFYKIIKKFFQLKLRQWKS